MTRTQLLGHGQVMEDYVDPPDFGKIVNAVYDRPKSEYQDCYILDNHLFHGKRLCVPFTLLLNLLLWETNTSCLSGHFSVNETIHALEYKLYWPSFKRDLRKIVFYCLISSRAKRTKQNYGLYTPVQVQMRP
ncbi:uncharacterized protein LOC144710890 [Wolffia australiana]